MGARLKACGILIIRPASLGDALAEKIRAEQGEAILLPVIDILPAARPARLAMVIGRLHIFDWAIFISPTAVREGFVATIDWRGILICRWSRRPRRARV